MDLDKVKGAVNDHRDEIEEKGGEVADKKLGDKADTAKEGLKKGLDALGDK